MADKTSQPGADDDTQRKFREALERKKAKDRAAHGEDHLAGGGVGGSRTDKSRREFRRKAGG